MNNFIFITPEEYIKLIGVDPKRLPELKRKARQEAKPCIICGVEKEWKLCETEMCFSCTTGEADASKDYELVEETK